MFGSHDSAANSPPMSAVRHRGEEDVKAMVRPRIGIVKPGGSPGALSLSHGQSWASIYSENGENLGAASRVRDCYLSSRRWRDLYAPEFEGVD